jgi:hypothetical protein
MAKPKPKAKAKAKTKAKVQKPKTRAKLGHRTAPKRSVKVASKPKKKPKKKIPPPSPSGRVLAACATLPRERPLTDEERDAMAKVAATARSALDGLGSAPDSVIAGIASFVDEVRLGRRPEPRSQDLRLGLGVLWGEQLRSAAGWHWVHLTYPDGFASYALVPEDRAFACFPLNRIPDALRAGAAASTAVHVFASVRAGKLPVRKEQSYLVIG